MNSPRTPRTTFISPALRRVETTRLSVICVAAGTVALPESPYANRGR